MFRRSVSHSCVPSNPVKACEKVASHLGLSGGFQCSGGPSLTPACLLTLLRHVRKLSVTCE